MTEPNKNIVCTCKLCGNTWEAPRSVFSHGLPYSAYKDATKAIYNGCKKCTKGGVRFRLE